MVGCGSVTSMRLATSTKWPALATTPLGRIDAPPELRRHAGHPCGSGSASFVALRRQDGGTRKLARLTCHDTYRVGAGRRAIDRRRRPPACSPLRANGFWAFLPLGDEELNPTTGRRVVHYGALVDEITEQLTHSGEVSKGTSGSGSGWYGRYFLLQGYGCFLHFSAHSWAAWGQSPMWQSDLK